MQRRRRAARRGFRLSRGTARPAGGAVWHYNVTICGPIPRTRSDGEVASPKADSIGIADADSDAELAIGT